MTHTHTRASAFVAGALLLACAAAARPGESTTDAAPVVLGTYDSRGLAVAYVHSTRFQSTMQGLFDELDRARAEGDAARVAELVALGPAMQDRIHRQGFSTAPVDDILALIDDRLPVIAAEAGVDVIVRRWDVLYAAPGATFVDVTDRLAAAFDPDAATWRAIHEIVAQDPVPEEELRREH